MSNSEPAAIDHRVATRGLRAVILVGAVVGAVVAGGALLLGLAIGRFYQSVTLMIVTAGLLLILMYAIAAATLRSFARRLGSRAVIGLRVGIALVLVTVVAWGGWTHFDPFAMSPEQVTEALDILTSEHREAFYLGRTEGGQHLEEISNVNGVLEFSYGRCPERAEGGCQHPLTVMTRPTKTFGSSGLSARGCKLLQPVLGVPAALLHGNLTVFTGSSMVTVMYLRTADGPIVDPGRQAAVAVELRDIDKPDAAITLPPPDAETQTFLQQHCTHES